ncbi:hypothetical protein OG933_02790 [Streptomyces sp. NBC_00016]|uniref:hypothetical protein n=1 Tax=Streptomyces sp. NBC_00016 TaxID=2975622 RepID=UPI0032556576
MGVGRSVGRAPAPLSPVLVPLSPVLVPESYPSLPDEPLDGALLREPPLSDVDEPS